ncbi:hypothetical protein AX15_007947 [Amanita polypyramis BW_CC]|nr:hypothetical protein AX15_007947 [Amanita polypyramis BW_CC]
MYSDNVELRKQNCGVASRTRTVTTKPANMTTRFSSDKVPRMAEMLRDAETYRTYAVISEVCFNYLLGWCYRGHRCYRIHPINKSPFVRILQERSGIGQEPTKPPPCTESVTTKLIRDSDFSALEESTPTVKLPLIEMYRPSNTDGIVSDLDRTGLENDTSRSTSRSPSGSTVRSWDPGRWLIIHDGENSSDSSRNGRHPNTGGWGDTDTEDGLVNCNPERVASSEISSNEPDQLLDRVVEDHEAWYNDWGKTIVEDWLANCNVTPPSAKPLWFATVHDYIKVKISDGFEVVNIRTGFESSIIYLHGIPSQITTGEMLRLLRPFGKVSEIRMPNSTPHSTKVARVRFSEPEEAQSAVSGIKRISSLGTELSVRLPISTATAKNAVFKDGTVVIEWEPSGKTWYAGYSDAVDAKKAITEARAKAPDSPIDARVHVGLPALGLVTVKFRGVPAHFTQQDVLRFTNSASVVYKRPKYTNSSRAENAIRSDLERFGRILSFHICPPSSRDYKFKAYAQFSSPAAADAACQDLHGSTPLYVGRTKIFAHHDRTVEYRISNDAYVKVIPDIDMLRQYIWKRYMHDASMTISGHNPVVVELRSRKLEILGKIKLEFEKTLSGEVVKSDGRVIWDDFFAQAAGIQYLQSLQTQNIRIIIRNESSTRKIRLFGSLQTRKLVAGQIVNKVSELRSQQVSLIPLAGRFVGVFTAKALSELWEGIGPENVTLDIYNRLLRIRGDKAVYIKALKFVHKVYAKYGEGRRGDGQACPVCFDEPTEGIQLRPCGHRWCRDCLSNYLHSAASNKSFPLACLGDEARCKQKIPLSVARSLLTADQFQAVVEASFSAYVQSHLDEFHYCPSPDCPQVYRTVQKSLAGTTVQCPSCLLRICAACHQEAHDDFSCADDDDWDENFQEWAKDRDVKRCPGCRISIERLEGCNHMKCTQCQTHICWVCMKTFPNGEGIYGHMRAEHGDFGLGPID